MRLANRGRSLALTRRASFRLHFHSANDSCRPSRTLSAALSTPGHPHLARSPLADSSTTAAAARAPGPAATARASVTAVVAAAATETSALVLP